MKKLYTAVATAVGGREGHAESNDGKLKVTLQPPKELGGPATGTGTNPEQLFAAGYAACFESAVRHVARAKKVSVTRSKVSAEVSLFGRDDGTFIVGVRLSVGLPELDRGTAEELVQAAHLVCPYSNATRGNVDVQLSVE
jgi:Ohr subfamily peroxiredoxin